MGGAATNIDVGAVTVIGVGVIPGAIEDNIPRIFGRTISRNPLWTRESLGHGN